MTRSINTSWRLRRRVKIGIKLILGVIAASLALGAAGISVQLSINSSVAIKKATHD